ncbi:hypothetical protein LTR37_004150 [Vermiconidia calcicola]|uniref:Uncharacterized protein n=1 Tax=Vermiconidia calcicola TaxID=1690605 RepID=A0ACC3NN15_9PEZI|nr:hypothetical protein LTR37_004150 [Vermiconidia calcicola]
MKDELRIFTPIGNIGYGYSNSIFWSTVESGNVDAIICDSGSTDSGPQKLALGSSTVPRESYEADLEPMVAAAHAYRVPTIIASAGGDGSNDHVDLFVEIIEKIVREQQFRTLKVVKIYAEIDKDTVASALHASPSGISPCGTGVYPLTNQDISSASRIVAQMGMQPFINAMHANPDFDIIIAGRSYDPAPYAAFCLYHNFADLGLAYHMGKIMECGAQCATPKSREALAVIRSDSFDVTPLDPGARCTSLSVAAHTLYEKTRPDFHYGPDGMLDSTKATYIELSDARSVRVQGSKFVQSTSETGWTIKLEGARTAGYHSIFVGGFADPILISQIDDLLARLKQYVASKCAFKYDLKLTVYGREDALSILGPEKGSGGVSQRQRQQPATIGILGQARAGTQREANMVVAMARIASVHGPYHGQKATSGNFGMPTAPMEISMGEVCEFNIYHLMRIEDPAEYFPIEVLLSEGSGKCEKVDKSRGPGTMTTAARLRSTKSSDPSNPVASGTEPFAFDPDQLGALASVIRAKNAGPFEITFDIMFSDLSTYHRVKSSGILTKTVVADLYGLDEAEVVTAMWWDQAFAFKATVTRPFVSGGWGEIDMHSSCQHVRLMQLRVPGMQQGLLASLPARLSQATTSLVKKSALGIPAFLVSFAVVGFALRQGYPAKGGFALLKLGSN